MKHISKEEFFKQLNSCEYGHQYLELVNNPKNHLGKKDKGEVHHIHPRSLGGDLKAKDNLVKLSYFNHTLAHIFLAEIDLKFHNIWDGSMLRALTEFTRRQFDKLTDIEKITIEEIYHWSKLRELGYKSLGELTSERLNSITKEEKKQIYDKVSNWYTDINNKKEHSKNTSEGTKIGWANMSDEARKKHSQNTSKSQSGKRLMIKAGEKKCVMKKDIQLYLNDGWIFSKKQKVKKTKEELKESRKKGANKRKGYRKMTNGIITKRVASDDIQTYKDNGWIFTYIYTSDKERNGHNNVKLMNNGISATWISIDDIPYYESIGYKFGGIKKKTSPVKGTICIYNGDDEKRIKPEEKEYYESLGWLVGVSDKTRNANSNSMKGKYKGRRLMTKNGIDKKYILLNDIQAYLLDNWYFCDKNGNRKVS